MAAIEEIWIPREVHNYDRGSTYRNDGEYWRGSLGIVRCYKWGQARMCTPRSSPCSYQQCSTRLSETWVMASTYSQDRALIYSTSHISERRELLFADDSALAVHSTEEMQKIVDTFSDASKKFGLKINIKKTEVLYQPNSTRTREDDIMNDGNKLCSGIHLPRKHYAK